MKKRKSIQKKLWEDLSFLINKKKIIEASPVKYTKANIWSVKKLILLSKYIGPYLKILTKKINGEYKYCKSWFYVDLFSGPGASFIKKGGINLIGSPIVSLLKGIFYIKKRDEYVRFTKWFFGDIKREYCDALKIRCSKTLKTIEEKYNVQVSKDDIKILNGDFNTNLQEVLKELESYEKFSILLFLDPEGFTEIEWSTLEELFKRKFVDIIWIFMTNMLKRGIREEHVGKNIPPLSKIEKRKILSRRCKEEEIVEIIVSKIFVSLKRKRFFAARIPVHNEKNVELYSIIWASSSAGATNAIRSTIEYIHKIRNDDILSTINVIRGKQLTLGGII